MRILLFGALCLVACKGSGSTSSSGTAGNATAYLPAEADLAVRVDMDRARAWPHFAKVAPLVTKSMQSVVDGLMTTCKLDVVGETKLAIVARKGADVTFVLGGLGKDRVKACAKPDGVLRASGDLLTLYRDGKPYAAGKLVGNDVVLVSRGGAAVDAAGFAAAAGKAAPTWLATLDAPASVWTVSPARKVLTKTEFGDPLVIKAVLSSEKLETAKRDQQLLYALSQYFTKANAGSVATAMATTSVDALLTVKANEIDAMIALVAPMFESEQLPMPAEPVAGSGSGSADAAGSGSAVGSAGSGSADPATPTEPDIAVDPKIAIDCFGLKASIVKYLEASVKASPAAGRAKMQEVAAQLRPELERVFSRRCIEDQWSEPSIRCHIGSAYAGKLARFEHCALSTTQRANLDKDLKDVMSKVGVAPITKESVKAAGSGSARP